MTAERRRGAFSTENRCSRIVANPAGCRSVCLETLLICSNLKNNRPSGIVAEMPKSDCLQIETHCSAGIFYMCGPFVGRSGPESSPGRFRLWRPSGVMPVSGRANPPGLAVIPRRKTAPAPRQREKRRIRSDRRSCLQYQLKWTGLGPLVIFTRGTPGSEPRPPR